MRRYVRVFLSLFLTFGAGFIGSVATMAAIETWYRTLEKPFLNPPDWIFGPVWTMLYALMGVALYRIWRLAHYRKDARTWTIVFLIHLFANAAWSVLFFGLHSPLFALILIAVLLLFIIWLTFRAWWIDRMSGWLLVPYLIWVSFATYLNFSIWLLN